MIWTQGRWSVARAHKRLFQRDCIGAGETKGEADTIENATERIPERQILGQAVAV
jgi:hypothetical protein